MRTCLRLPVGSRPRSPRDFEQEGGEEKWRNKRANNQARANANNRSNRSGREAKRRVPVPNRNRTAAMSAIRMTASHRRVTPGDLPPGATPCGGERHDQ